MKMTYKEFVKKYNNKYTDYDGHYGCQCWDLNQRYNVEVLKVPASVLSGCGLVSNMLKEPKRSVLLKYFTEVKTPQQGDIAIWEMGHIAIVDRKDYYFSQNPNPCKIMKITKGGVHFFRLKSKTTPATSSKYYKKYTGSSGSIVDALKSIGADSSFNNRRAIAKANNISGYIGTAKQNNLMLSLLKQGKLIKRP